MKRFLLLFATVAIFAVGCQTDSTTDNAVGVIGEGTVLTVALEQTRTSLGEKVGDTYPYYWSEGDQIMVNGKLSDEVQIDAENRSLATFRFSKDVLKYPYYITYPYSDLTTDKEQFVEFKAEQSYTKGTFSTESAPMCGYVANKGEATKLQHLASVLRFPIVASYNGIVLEKVVITSQNKIAGNFAVDCTNATLSSTESCGNIITYHLPADFTLSTTKPSDLFIVLPGVEVGACTIEFVESSGSKMVANWATGKPLSKGVVREFKTITYQPKATISLQPLTSEEDEFAIFYKNLHGYVRYSDGTPIKNVAVSDGFQVVATNSNGYYELKNVTRDTWYIYCSLPSDVKVPIDELGRPCFFKKYVENTKQYDFTFEKLAGGKEKKFALLALADPQAGSTTGVERFKAQGVAEIKNYTAKLGQPCYGIVLGDIISNGTGERGHVFDDMQEALSYSNAGIPMFPVYGNHDNCDYTASKPIFADERNSTYNLKIQRHYEDTFGPVDYSFNRGDVHIVSIRNTQYDSNVTPAGDYTTMEFTDRQYEWLKQDLALVPKSKMVVLCVHIPICNYLDHKHIDDVLDLLDTYNEAHILSGHLHYRKCYEHVRTQHTIFEQSITSAHGTGWGDNANLTCDGAPMGYEMLFVENGTFTKWFYKGYPAGMDAEDYQIRLHRGGDITGAAIPEGDANKVNKNGTKGYYKFPYESNVILANVFSSDPSWKVEVWKYNESTGKKTTYIGDMTSLEKYANTPTFSSLIGSFTYDDPKRPKSGVDSARDFWTIGILLGHLGTSTSQRYHVCRTMWKYELSDANANAKVMVVATDSFGNEYTQTEFQVGTEFGDALYDASKNPK